MNFTTTSSSGSEFQCVPGGNKWIYVLLMPLPIVAGCINLIVWLAATIYRTRLLRQSYVYSCVSSTLLSNALFLSFHLWEEVAGFMRPDKVASSPPGGKMQILWALCQSAAISMLFVMCGNLSVLIYVMLDSTHFQKTSRKRVCSTAERNRKRTIESTEKLDSKRRRASFLIVFCWLIPLALTIAAVYSWNCASICHCSPGAKGEICPRAQGCSQIWAPMTNSFLGVNVALWFLEVASLLVVTITGIRSFESYHARNSSHRSNVTNVVTYRFSSEYRTKSVNSSNSTANYDDAPANKAPNSKDDKIIDDVFHPVQTTARKVVRFNPRLRLIVILSSVFILGTFLIPLSFFVDVATTNYSLQAIRVPAMILVQIYTLLCPILLVKYMSNLKTAMIRLASAVLFC